MTSAPAPEAMSTTRRVLYGIGAGGWQITDRLVVTVAVYFYLPPEGRGLDTLVSERLVLGFLTFYGLAMLIGRLFDAVADPLVGYASDRSRSRLGRRRLFLVLGVVPMLVAPALLFFPPSAGESTANFYWLTGLLAVYFIFFTMYVGPYLALIPELAWTQQERVQLGTYIAIGSMPFVILISIGWPLFFEWGQSLGLSPPDAMRALAVGATGLAVVLCLIPILCVDERRFARSHPSDLPLREALSRTLRNRPFRVYLGAQLFFVLGINLITPLAPYLATVVLGRSEGFAARLGAGTFLGLVIGFAIQGALVRRFGAKRIMMAAVALLAVAMSLLGLLRADVPGGPNDAANLVLSIASIALFGIPIAAVAVVPHVLISQLIDADEARTGANRSAMFFGVQGFLTKGMYGVSLWVFTLLLLRFGKSPEEPLGVILVGPVAAVACLVSLVIWARYPEREVLAETSRTLSS